MICLDNLSPDELLVLTNTLALSFSEDKNINEINSLANFFIGVGGLMTIIASQQQLLSSLQKQNNTTT